MLRDYQIDAINSFKNNNYNGILQMATGTGKTYTAINIFKEIFNCLPASPAPYIKAFVILEIFSIIL